MLLPQFWNLSRERNIKSSQFSFIYIWNRIGEISTWKIQNKVQTRTFFLIIRDTHKKKGLYLNIIISTFIPLCYCVLTLRLYNQPTIISLGRLVVTTHALLKQQVWHWCSLPMFELSSVFIVTLWREFGVELYRVVIIVKIPFLSSKNFKYCSIKYVSRKI